MEDISTTSAKSRSSNLDANFHLIQLSPWPNVLLMTQSVTIKNKNLTCSLRSKRFQSSFSRRTRAETLATQATWHVTSLFDAGFNVKPPTLELFIEYFYHPNNLLSDAVFLYDCPHAFSVDRVERLFKIYEVQIECCLPLVNLFNDVPQYKYLFCRTPAFSISCLFYR